jgi:hypothetical protein
VTAYKKSALWDRVKAWFDGAGVPDTRIDTDGAFRHAFDSSRGLEWGQWEPGVGRYERKPIVAGEFVRPVLPDPYSLAYEPTSELVKRVQENGMELMMLPEFYRFIEDRGERGSWVAVAPEAVPAETELAGYAFPVPEEPPAEAYVTPDAPDSCWKTPGPVAGPFTAHPGDGSEITYYWYRFADQPSMLNAGLGDDEREAMQRKVETIHRHWSKDDEYLAPPLVGTLAAIDPALIVTPPEGLEVGYVPIVTRQGMPA